MMKACWKPRHTKIRSANFRLSLHGHTQEDIKNLARYGRRKHLEFQGLAGDENEEVDKLEIVVSKLLTFLHKGKAVSAQCQNHNFWKLILNNVIPSQWFFCYQAFHHGCSFPTDKVLGSN